MGFALGEGTELVLAVGATSVEVTGKDRGERSRGRFPRAGVSDPGVPHHAVFLGGDFHNVPQT